MNISLSKKTGDPVFIVKSGKNKGKKVKLNMNHDKKSGEPIKEYDTGEQLQMLPAPKGQRTTMIVTGPNSSGKSYFASMFIKEYKKKYPHNCVYLISAKKKDAALDVLNVERLKMNRVNWVDDPPVLEEFEDSLVVFDDVEMVPKDDKAIKTGIDNFKNKILLQGRSLNISIIIVCHILLDYRSTTIQNSETTHITIFPSSGATYQIKKFFNTYCGLSKQQVEEILAVKSRYVTLHKAYPMWYLTCDKFKLL